MAPKQNPETFSLDFCRGLWESSVHPIPSLMTSRTPPACTVGLCQGLPGMSYLFFRWPGLGWALTVLAGSGGASGSRDGDLGEKALLSRMLPVTCDVSFIHTCPHHWLLPGAAPKRQKNHLGCRNKASRGPPLSPTVGGGVLLRVIRAPPSPRWGQRPSNQSPT